MHEWLVPTLSIAGSVIGGYIGVKVGLTRLEERHMALSRRFDEHAANVTARLQIIGDRTHDHANRLSEHTLILRDVTERLARIERNEDQR